MYRIILCLALSLGTAHAGLSRLAALSMIESGDDDSVVGGVGEVSRYQIKPWIWRLYSASEDYRSPVIASYVAEKHLSALEDTFRKRAKRQPSDFDLYVLWNAGPTYYGRIAFSPSSVHPVIKDRARRYANLRQAGNLGPQPTLAQATAPKGSQSIQPAPAVALPTKATVTSTAPTVATAQQVPSRNESPLPISPARPELNSATPSMLAIGRMPAP